VDGVFTIAKGKFRYYYELPAANDAILVVLLQSSGLEADDVLADHADLAALLAAANDEATFTGYARKVLTAATITPDSTNNWVDVALANQVWNPAGGATNNTLGKLLTCYDPDTTAGTDSTVVPLTYHDFVWTTDGTALPADFATAGVVRAKSET
jgi:hypothetical protein